MTTVAGSGEQGFADGDAFKAKFDGPAGIAVDAAGNVYVAEIFSHRIRKIVPDQRVLTFAGDGKVGFNDGPATEARFRAPVGIALSMDGTLFVADAQNHVIRKITP